MDVIADSILCMMNKLIPDFKCLIKSFKVGESCTIEGYRHIYTNHNILVFVITIWENKEGVYSVYVQYNLNTGVCGQTDSENRVLPAMHEIKEKLNVCLKKYELVEEIADFCLKKYKGATVPEDGYKDYMEMFYPND